MQIQTQLKQLSRREKIDISTTDISKMIKQQLNKEFKGCKFSIRTEYYSGGSSISVSLMKADFKVKKTFEELSEEILSLKEEHGYDRAQIKSLQEQENHQLNEFALRDDFSSLNWCNGVFLTEEGHNVLKRVAEISNQYNYDNSDSQIDYFDVNFYLHLEIGRWDKAFVEEK